MERVCLHGGVTVTPSVSSSLPSHGGVRVHQQWARVGLEASSRTVGQVGLEASSRTVGQGGPVGSSRAVSQGGPVGSSRTVGQGVLQLKMENAINIDLSKRTSDDEKPTDYFSHRHQ